MSKSSPYSPSGQPLSVAHEPITSQDIELSDKAWREQFDPDHPTHHGGDSTVVPTGSQKRVPRGAEEHANWQSLPILNDERSGKGEKPGTQILDSAGLVADIMTEDANQGDKLERCTAVDLLNRVIDLRESVGAAKKLVTGVAAPVQTLAALRPKLRGGPKQEKAPKCNEGTPNNSTSTIPAKIDEPGSDMACESQEQPLSEHTASRLDAVVEQCGQALQRLTAGGARARVLAEKSTRVLQSIQHNTSEPDPEMATDCAGAAKETKRPDECGGKLVDSDKLLQQLQQVPETVDCVIQSVKELCSYSPPQDETHEFASNKNVETAQTRCQNVFREGGGLMKASENKQSFGEFMLQLNALGRTLFSLQTKMLDVIKQLKTQQRVASS
eukprot:GHVQ01022832.1.p1 GENE.GHVQ01022832.1~~GHVQ01022832.1.p1  ORF type:complete len:385 (+),score=62.81 GHVQ01022832.1:402-1556(+)